MTGMTEDVANPAHADPEVTREYAKRGLNEMAVKWHGLVSDYGPETSKNAHYHPVNRLAIGTR